MTIHWTHLCPRRGGIFGALERCVCLAGLGGTGVYDYVANKVGDYDMLAQVTSQAWGVGVTIVWTGLVSLIAYKMSCGQSTAG